MGKERFKVIPAIYVIFQQKGQQGKVLLLKRANTGYMDGMYSMPAGHVDGDEPAVEAAVREAREEVAVTLTRDDLRLVHVMHRQAADPGDSQGKHERIDLFFAANTWTGELANNEPEKCSELRWAAIDALPENMVPEVKLALQRVAAGEVYSDFNFSRSLELA